MHLHDPLFGTGVGSKLPSLLQASHAFNDVQFKQPGIFSLHVKHLGSSPSSK